MDARELRIGNFVHNNVESFQIQAKDLIFLLAFDNEHYANPIPLTEDWLDKFKFRKYNNIRFEHDMLAGDIVKGNGFYLANVKPEMKWVHQLQNAFYAITGEELEVK